MNTAWACIIRFLRSIAGVCVSGSSARLKARSNIPKTLCGLIGASLAFSVEEVVGGVVEYAQSMPIGAVMFVGDWSLKNGRAEAGREKWHVKCVSLVGCSRRRASGC